MPTVLILIASDPRTSHRPAEAIRIAAGVGVWKKADMTVYLRDTAVLALREDTEGFVDEGNYTRYLPLVRDSGRPIYVQRGATLLPKAGETSSKFKELDDDELARLAAGSTYVIRF